MAKIHHWKCVFFLLNLVLLNFLVAVTKHLTASRGKEVDFGSRSQRAQTTVTWLRRFSAHGEAERNSSRIAWQKPVTCGSQEAESKEGPGI
jgi:hypothetical protein